MRALLRSSLSSMSSVRSQQPKPRICVNIEQVMSSFSKQSTMTKVKKGCSLEVGSSNCVGDKEIDPAFLLAGSLTNFLRLRLARDLRFIVTRQRHSSRP